jgi:hypothetical protein
MKTVRTKRKRLSLALTVLLIGPTINSTTLARMSVAQITQAAQLIVRARCAAQSTEWDSGEIWTLTSFAVEETWKGNRGVNSNSYLTVRLLGGSVGSLTSTVSGVPRFTPGEEVILFLEPSSRGDYSIVSWVQGTFRLRHNVHTGQQIATQDTASFDTFEPKTRQFGAIGLRDIPVEDLHSMVSSQVCATANCAKGEK